MASQVIRSNSLPSRPHPIASDVDELISRVRSSESASTSSISQKLNGLQDLHACVEKFLQLPQSQQTLSQEKNRKWVDALLDGSLVILDLCSSAKDFVQQAKESSHNLQSVLRRRCAEAEFAAEVKKYLTSRKALKKAINKALKNKEVAIIASDDSETMAIVSMLKQVEEVTFSVLQSLLSMIKGQSKKNSFFSKLMSSKKIGCEEEESEFEKVDAAIKMCKSGNMMQSQLKDLESCIQDLEEGLDCLSRSLIKTRVSLLNIITY